VVKTPLKRSNRMSDPQSQSFLPRITRISRIPRIQSSHSESVMKRKPEREDQCTPNLRPPRQCNPSDDIRNPRSRHAEYMSAVDQCRSIQAICAVEHHFQWSRHTPGSFCRTIENIEHQLARILTPFLAGQNHCGMFVLVVRPNPDADYIPLVQDH
jgi:hypothetical protein